MDETTKAVEKEGKVDVSRREALAKLGAYAAFTVPAVTALLVSQKASALSIIIGSNTPRTGDTPVTGQPKANDVRVA